MLSDVAKRLSIKIKPLMSRNRCERYGGLLCWPHDSRCEVLDTFRSIQETHDMRNVIGFIGFSNGAFFLNRLIQYVPLNKPIIAIGGGGHYMQGASYDNNLYLLIGVNDKHHYQNVLDFVEAAENNIKISLVVHGGDHEIPKNILENLIKEIQP